MTPQDRQVLYEALWRVPAFATVRGRQTLVRNALSGYRYSARIEETLGYVDWEGSPIEVAGTLLRYLEGQLADTGIPALALLAQAIEPLTAPGRREALAAMRLRLGWGAVEPPPAEPATWKDHRSGAAIGEERIIGENTLKPLYFLRRALAAAAAVVRIDVRGIPNGTGFLAGPDLVMTAHHVIGDQAYAPAVQACFFNEVADPRAAEAAAPDILVPAAVDPIVYANPRLDVVLLRLNSAPSRVPPLPLRPKQMEQNERVAIIQHPGGFPKQISIQNNMVAFADQQIVQYYTSTKGGSSGAPVLDEDFAVVALHRRWVHHEAASEYRNEGVSMIAILAHLRAAHPALFGELTVWA